MYDMDKNHTVIVITEGFPFGGEPFLESEIKWAPQNTIYFAMGPQKKEKNDNVQRKAFSLHRRNVISVLFKGIKGFLKEKWVIEEMKYMKKRHKLTPLSLCYSLFFLGNALHAKEDIIILLQEHKIDVKNAVFYSYWMHEQALVGALLKECYPNTAFISRAHGFDSYEFRPKAKYVPFRLKIFGNADKIFCASKELKKYLEDVYGNLVKQKVMVSYLGTVNHGKSFINQRRKEKLKIVSCSNLIELKRVHMIIQALGLIRNRQIEWVHYGDGPLFEKTKQLAEVELGDNIDWSLNGYVHNEQLIREMKQDKYDLFISTSETEGGCPVSIQEAFSFGIPAIATAVGGIPEIVSSDNGILLDKDFEITELVNAIITIMDMKEEKYNEMRQQARKRWENRFDAENNYRMFFDIIQNEIISGEE